jgi:hypothetical protein
MTENLIITTFDKLLRELDIIETIFKAQSKVFVDTLIPSYPMIFDTKGKIGIDGKYLGGHYTIISDFELFNIQSYKEEFTKRYETSNNTTLLKNQLLEILEKATEIRNYYNTNLTGKNKIAADYLSIQKQLNKKKNENEKDYSKRFDEKMRVLELHSTIISITHLHIDGIYFGINYADKNAPSNTFNYLMSNFLLATFCQYLIEFIDRFNLRTKKNSDNKLQTLSDIFQNDNTKISIIKTAISDLSITKDCSDRVISGFIDGCKYAHALPDFASLHLMKVIYNQIGKPIGENIKHHTDQPAYNKSWKATKKYFGV